MLSRPTVSSCSRWLLVCSIGPLLTLSVGGGAGCATSDPFDLGTGGAGGTGGIPYTTASTTTYGSTYMPTGYTGSGGYTSSISSTGDSSSSTTDGSTTGGGAEGPKGISLAGSTSTKQVGNPSGGSPADDRCPMGQALIGFTGALSNAGGYLGKVQGHCATLNLSTSVPYTITTTTGATLPEHGTFTAAPWSSLCPADQVVVGFEGRSGNLVDQISLHCAPLIISGPPYAVTLGSFSVLPSVGGAGGNPFSSIDCPAGQIVTAGHIRTGDGVDAFGLTCSNISLTF